MRNTQALEMLTLYIAEPDAIINLLLGGKVAPVIDP
jgi:hypothetical protein